jgi:hypothetical protein
MARVVMMIAGAFLVSGCSLFGIRSGYEHAPYRVIDRPGDGVEVRRYPPQVVAEAVVEAADKKSGRNQAFRALFDYISGNNRARAKIAMTAPVETGRPSETIAMTVPVETTAAPAAGRYTMRFFLPDGYDLTTAPEPLDARVHIREVPERTLAVLRFSGSASAANVARHTAELANTVAASSWHAVGEPTAMFYDPPWTLPPLRRNEVAVAVAVAGGG